jgi:hypothetical protein
MRDLNRSPGYRHVKDEKRAGRETNLDKLDGHVGQTASLVVMAPTPAYMYLVG